MRATRRCVWPLQFRRDYEASDRSSLKIRPRLYAMNRNDQFGGRPRHLHGISLAGRRVPTRGTFRGCFSYPARGPGAAHRSLTGKFSRHAHVTVLAIVMLGSAHLTQRLGEISGQDRQRQRVSVRGRDVNRGQTESYSEWDCPHRLPVVLRLRLLARMIR
jgi:hypothetical protein